LTTYVFILKRARRIRHLYMCITYECYSREKLCTVLAQYYVRLDMLTLKNGLQREKNVLLKLSECSLALSNATHTKTCSKTVWNYSISNDTSVGPHLYPKSVLLLFITLSSTIHPSVVTINLIIIYHIFCVGLDAHNADNDTCVQYVYSRSRYPIYAFAYATSDLFRKRSKYVIYIYISWRAYRT